MVLCDTLCELSRQKPRNDGTGANISASVIFIVRGVVDWPAAILLCIGCFIGGYIASPVTRRIPARIMRIAAVLAGIVLTVDLAMKTYL